MSAKNTNLPKIIAAVVVVVIVVGTVVAAMFYNRATASGCAQILKAVQVQHKNLDTAHKQATDVVGYIAQNLQDSEKAAYLADFVTENPSLDGDAAAGTGEGDKMVAQLKKLYQKYQVPEDKPACSTRDDIDELTKKASEVHDQAVELSDAAQQLRKATDDRIEAGKLIVQARRSVDTARHTRESAVLNAQATIEIAHDEGFVDPAVDELVSKISALQSLPLTTDIGSSDQANEAVSQAQEITKACAELDQLSTDLTRKTNDYTTRKVGLNPVHHG